jgi:DNA-binding HxlR family transcriptional regulator
MTGHTDYRPVAAGVSRLGDQWTPVVISDVMVGAGGCNETHGGDRRGSRTRLAQRLRQLERHGRLDRGGNEGGRPGRSALRPTLEALTKIGWAMGDRAADRVGLAVGADAARVHRLSAGSGRRTPADRAARSAKVRPLEDAAGGGGRRLQGTGTRRQPGEGGPAS